MSAIRLSAPDRLDGVPMPVGRGVREGDVWREEGPAARSAPGASADARGMRAAELAPDTEEAEVSSAAEAGAEAATAAEADAGTGRREGRPVAAEAPLPTLPPLLCTLDLRVASAACSATWPVTVFCSIASRAAI